MYQYGSICYHQQSREGNESPTLSCRHHAPPSLLPIGASSQWYLLIWGSAAAVIECPMELVKAKVQVARTRVDVVPYRVSSMSITFLLVYHAYR
jgi:hypothetical protein